MERKKVGVLFSGGVDSTYLVWDNLKKGNEVSPIYFEIKNNGDKPALEKNRVELLYEEFYKEFHNINTPRYILSVDVMDINTKLHLSQVPVWILGLLFSQLTHLDEIQIGYVMNDDAISYIDDIKKIYESYNSISEPLIPISFPIIKQKKQKIFYDLPEKYRDLTVTCENPKIKGNVNAKKLEYIPCGCCDACERQINTGIYNDFNDQHKKARLIEDSFFKLNKYGDILESKTENDRLIVTFSLPYLNKEPLVEPTQLRLEFKDINP